MVFTTAMKKGLIVLVLLAGLVYLFWGPSNGTYDAPQVTGDQTEAAAVFNRAVFLEKAADFMPRGMILKTAEGRSDHEVRIIVAEQWNALDYGVRLRFARKLWKTWAKLFPTAAGYTARIVIVDRKGRKLGGSRLLNSSNIWVREM